MAKRQVLCLVVCVFLSGLAFAADPPGRVARLNYFSGQVSIQPNGVKDWVQASMNRPLTTSDRIFADKDSRAELQMGAATARLDSNTSLTLANVSDQAVQLQLDQGTLNLHVMTLFKGEAYEIDTPNLAFVVEKAGDYRFDVDNAGDSTVVTVWKGRGTASGDSPAIKISAGQQMTFRDGRSLQYVTTNAPGMDGFDTWCMARAEREDKSPALQYVSPYAVGYSDLDQYGTWQTVAPYGPVWVPAGVAVGWAPYRWGHWVFIAPWGWTWVDDSPWGFAPYHYGRWVSFGSYWGWCPGPVYVRPYYAPALVGWVGGAGWGVGLSFGIGGGVGWFPLGWGEPYIPWYHGSRAYFHNVNVTNTHITNITYITNNYYGSTNLNGLHYVNHTPGAITAVSNATFTGARPVREGMVPVSTQALRGTSVIGAVPVRPTGESFTSAHAAPVPPAAIFNRPVVTRMRPGSPAAVPNVSRGPVMGVTNEPVRTYPHPGQSAGPVNEARETVPAGVPHLPQTFAGKPAVADEGIPSRVPHPPAAAVTSPVNANGVHTNGTTVAPERSYPHPIMQPGPAATVNRQPESVGHAPEVHNMPTPSGPVRVPESHTVPSPSSAPHVPAPTHNGLAVTPNTPKPAPSTNPVPKPGKSSSLYPSPDNGSVRPAAMPASFPHPTGPVHPAPASFTSGSAPMHSYSGAYVHAPAASRTPSSYRGGARPTYSAPHMSAPHVSAPSSTHASASHGRG